MDDQQPPQRGSTPAPWRARPEVLAPFSRAWDWTVHVLFTTGTLGKWLCLGFCAFLALLGRGGGGGSLNVPSNLGSSKWNPESSSFPQNPNDAWLGENVWLIIAIIGGIFIVAFALALIVTWLSSRGMFMFVDGTVHNRGFVKQPWHVFRSHGNALFRFRVVVGVITFAVFCLMVGGSIGIIAAFADSIDSGGALFIIPFILGVLALCFAMFCLALYQVFVFDFVAPIMWVRGCRPSAAFKELFGLVQEHLGAFILYFLFKILLGLVFGIVACVATCVTCCIAALPYIGTVLLLPLLVLNRSYSLYFLSQLQPDYGPLAPQIEPLFDPSMTPTPRAPVGTDEAWARPPESTPGGDPTTPNDPIDDTSSRRLGSEPPERDPSTDRQSDGDSDASDPSDDPER